MASVTTKPNPSLEPLPFANRIVPVNSTPEDFDAARDLPEGFLEFLAPLHAALTLRQRALVARRDYALAEAHAGKLPDRSEEHTSELQSLRHLVCRLLLEKKNRTDALTRA